MLSRVRPLLPKTYPLGNDGKSTYNGCYVKLEYCRLLILVFYKIRATITLCFARARPDKGAAMTGNELEQALKQIGWQKADLAERLGLNPNTVSAWVKDAAPAYAVEYVKTLLALWEILEPPRKRAKREQTK